MLSRTVAASLVVAATLLFPSAAIGEESVTSSWQMDEPAGATVMTDSVGDNDGVIGSQAAYQGLVTTGSYYHWKQRCSACLPVANDRVVKVPDAADGSLEVPDASVTFSLEFRFKTTSNAGNYMQKGQSATRGGQIKVQGPKGNVQCSFKGAGGTRVGTGAGRALNDGQWHVVKCVRTSTQVRQYVDGVLVAIKNGATGPIDNSTPFTVGGKSNCDQQKVTCDYFVGQMDWIAISHG